MSIEVAVPRRQCIDRSFEGPDPGWIKIEPASKPGFVRPAVWLKDVVVPAESHVVNQVKRESTGNLTGDLRKFNARPGARHPVAGDLWQQRRVAKTLTNQMQLVATPRDLGN